MYSYWKLHESYSIWNLFRSRCCKNGVQTWFCPILLLWQGIVYLWVFWVQFIKRKTDGIMEQPNHILDIKCSLTSIIEGWCRFPLSLIFMKWVAHRLSISGSFLEIVSINILYCFITSFNLKDLVLLMHADLMTRIFNEFLVSMTEHTDDRPEFGPKHRTPKCRLHPGVITTMFLCIEHNSKFHVRMSRGRQEWKNYTF